ncbi:hypothetical protein CHS0354_019971 [Potamilus streckersoni]|uniref:RWD domain-containing protein n=1 Tax=Potamilus streckersoni TaxID=2493646 RepID=A0AAE0VMD6_9BIVA|nr:hypothetical protein CHS0354_019971 [Potamilus streckersoni]
MATPEAEISSIQDKEISEIRSQYPGQIKVLSFIGKIQHVVMLSFKDLDLQLKFQLTDEYPNSAASVSVRSTSLSHDQQEVLISHLQEEAELNKGQSVMTHLADRALHWLQDNSIDLKCSTDGKTDKKNEKRKNKRKEKKSEKGNDKTDNPEDNSSSTPAKKSAMKTAADVIKRIQWDSGLNHQDFYVGYFDRFLGIVEKCFTAFTWEDIASVDMFTLTIPQHRIQYFKYKTEVVWDKGERIDNVFGSTGSNLTITKVIKIYEEKENEKREEDDRLKKESDGAVGAQSSVENNTESMRDDVKILMEALSIEKPMYFEGNHETNQHQEKKVGHINTRKKPNFFLSLDISDENVRKNAKEVQEILTSCLPNYADYIQPESTFHITLAIMNLEDPDHISHCSKLLKEMEPALVEFVRKVPPLNIRGVGNFGKGIIFAGVKVSKEFSGFIHLITESLQEGGVYICKESRGYNPHLTLIKCPRGLKEMASHEKIAQCIHPFKHRNFGAQTLDAIHLYQMVLEDDRYIEEAVIKF